MDWAQLGRNLGRELVNAIAKGLRTQPARRPRSERTASRRGSGGTDRQRTTRGGAGRRDYPGDFTGTPAIAYDPRPGDAADPGEVVWAWVPYEEDYSDGKDRPVLVIGRDRSWLLGVPLTSQDHDRDARQEAAEGRYWLDVGAGPWDSSGRSSEARLDRIVRIDPDRVRRVGGRLDRSVFDEVADGVRRHAGR